MDDIERKKQDLMKAYSSDTWKRKVEKMSSAQVIAIHIRFKNEGKI